MVQPFKCDTCRARKVRCDQGRPVCRPCKVKNRECTYRRDNDSIFIHENIDSDALRSLARHAQNDTIVQNSDGTTELCVRQSRRVDSGGGLYQTLRPKHARFGQRGANDEHQGTPRQFSLQNALTTPQSFLMSRWTVAVGPMDPGMNPFDTVINLTPLLAKLVASSKTDTTLDLALEYFVSSAEQFWHAGGMNTNPARPTGQRALKRLRQDLRVQQPNDNMLLAIILHEVAEVFMSLGTYYYTCHTLGCSLMLQQRFAAGACRDLDLIMLEGVHYEEIVEAMLEDRNSLFDNATVDNLLDDAVATARCGTPASWRLVKWAIKTPRLVRLTRYCSINLDDKSTLVKTTAFAESLYTGGLMEDMRAHSKSLAMAHTQDPRIAEAVPQSFSSFASVRDYSLDIRRASVAVIICALWLRLFSIRAESNVVDAQSVADTDIEAGMVIAQALDYAFSHRRGIPMARLRILVPMYISLATWIRLEARSSSSDDVEHARKMLSFKLETIKLIQKEWRAGPETLSVRLAKTDALNGAPLTDLTRRKVDWSAVWESI